MIRSRSETVAPPAWITEELIAETLDVWQPYYANRLTRADAIEILRSVGRLVDVLETPAK
jgi:hypothetical protein